MMMQRMLCKRSNNDMISTCNCYLLDSDSATSLSSSTCKRAISSDSDTDKQTNSKFNRIIIYCLMALTSPIVICNTSTQID